MSSIKNFSRLTKIFLHYKLKYRILPYLPIRAWLEPTNKCNLKCMLCPNSTDTKSKRGNMDYKLFKNIVDQMVGHVNDVNLSHRGESLFHPDIFKMIRYCRNKGLKTRIHSNATPLDKPVAKELIKSGLDLLSFSFDGYDKETYERIRINGNFEVNLSKIIDFLSIKKNMGCKKPFTIIQVIMGPGYSQTIQHKETFMKNFQDLPLDRLYVKEAHNWGGNMDINACPDALNNHCSFSMCTFPWYAITILYDGKVVPCPQDWFVKLTLGDLNNQTLAQIWNGKPLFDLRTRMVKMNLDGILCKTCDRPWRKQIMGIPIENATTFVKEHLLGYGSLKTS